MLRQEVVLPVPPLWLAKAMHGARRGPVPASFGCFLTRPTSRGLPPGAGGPGRPAAGSGRAGGQGRKFKLPAVLRRKGSARGRPPAAFRRTLHHAPPAKSRRRLLATAVLRA